MGAKKAFKIQHIKYGDTLVIVKYPKPINITDSSEYIFSVGLKIGRGDSKVLIEFDVFSKLEDGTFKSSIYDSIHESIEIDTVVQYSKDTSSYHSFNQHYTLLLSDIIRYLKMVLDTTFVESDKYLQQIALTLYTMIILLESASPEYARALLLSFNDMNLLNNMTTVLENQAFIDSAVNVKFLKINSK